MSSSRILKFRQTVWEYYKAHGRHDLPWRKLGPLPTGRRAYRILVSEVMLQQTQVPRVIGKYKEFLKKFPTVQALARAPLGSVLKVWSGLGYNRRGKYLHDAAKEIVAIGNLKEALAGPLPGVGPYTRAAVRVFAYNEPDVLIETNIRAAFIHHFYPFRTRRVLNGLISDKQILLWAAKAAQRQNPRTWHWALMDYGAYLKRSGIRNNSRSAHYTKQSKFEGSLRQVRGAILRELHKSQRTEQRLRLNLNLPRSHLGRKLMMEIRSPSLKKALAALARDRLIVKVRPRRNGLGPKKGKWRIA